MADPIVEGDTYDPCAEWVELRNARSDVLKGGAIKRSRFRNGEEERDTEFTTANLDQLDKAIERARRECLLKQDPLQRPLRSAIGIGHHGPRYPRIY